jgi:Domain of unknown function (DUF4336)
MTVIRLFPSESNPTGGLFIYNPIAKTSQLTRMIQPLIDAYGPIQDIVVGSLALEHKVYAADWINSHRQTATLWLQPGQYSFPTNLPNSFLGFPPNRTKTIPASAADAPAAWRGVLDFCTLGPIISRDGAFGETVFYHRPTETLLVTDTALQCTDQELPKIYETDHVPLLYHARDTITDIVADTPETLRRGWRRIQLFGLYFMPSAITIKDASLALKERRPDINSEFAGIYPWDWNRINEQASWAGLTGTVPGKCPLVAPILQVLLLNRSPVEVLDFADRVSHWNFRRIIPAHLKNNLQFNGAQYRAAFGFLEAKGVPDGYPKPLDQDLQFLRDAEVGLIQSGAIALAPPAVGTNGYSRSDILARTTYRCRNGVCAPRSLP